jgi:hypothetical protein
MINPMITTEQTPHEQIWTLTNANVPAVCLHLAAELGVADRVGDDPVPIADLAAALEADPDALDRVLSLLAAHGIFERTADGFAHTPASRLLRSDHEMSIRAFPRMSGLPVFATVFANLEHSVRTGAPAIETIEPGGLWAYLRDRPDEQRVFADAMSARAAGDIAAIIDAYDFGRFATIADIAGGYGHLLAAVLDTAPAARGVLFELPGVVAGLAVDHERLTATAGDFFTDPLPSADAYLLMEILHDWPDRDCREILAAVRRAAEPGARLLVLEEILGDRGRDPDGHTLDVIMLAVTGGRERTIEELDGLFAASGFSPGRTIDTRSRLRIVETTAI